MLTQEELAERAGLSVRTVRGFEADRIRRPHSISIRMLAHALGLAEADRDALFAAAWSGPAEPTLDRPGGKRGVGPGAAPCQLPMDIADFTDRTAQVEDLLRLLSADRQSHTVVISALSGKGGVGKTALAVHVAHRLRDRFIDGQLYVNLRGLAPHPADPAEVLARFLRALGVDGTAIPADSEERAGLYRGLLADRRVLVLLDNAAGAAQITPLLPGSETCAVLVTSRTLLTGLGERLLVELDVLEPDQAVALLGRIAGEARMTADPDAAARLARLCGYLPLALRVAGARLAAKPHWDVSGLLERLANERGRLDELTHGHLEVRASLALSYQTLAPKARILFRRLGLLDAPDVAGWVGAALLDSTVDSATAPLERLVDAQLIDIAGTDPTGQIRYRCHDLVRLYARERALRDDPPEQRGAALVRALGGWLALAERAHRAEHGATDQTVDAGTIHGDAPRWRPPDGQGDLLVAEPMAWFESERLALAAAIRQAAREGLDELCWDLALTCEPLYATRSYTDDWWAAYEHALAAVEQARNRRGQAALAYLIYGLHLAQGRFDEATASLERAKRGFEELGDRHGYALVLHELATVERTLGQLQVALRRQEEARTLLREVGDFAMEALALRALGQLHLSLGHPDLAESCLNQALALARRFGAKRAEAQILFRVSELELERGNLDRAEAALNEVLDFARRSGDRRGQAFALLGLGKVRLRQDRHEPARSALRATVALAGEIHHPLTAATALLHLGQMSQAEGRLQEAIQHYTEALAVCAGKPNPILQARILVALGTARQLLGDLDAAVCAWTQAHTILTELGSPEAHEVAERLLQAGREVPRDVPDVSPEPA